MALRFHAQTGGSTLTAQQPDNNVVRVAIQAFAAVCGGTQSLHTNAFDEALALPTEHSAKLALRTQQLLAAEAGALDTADPLGGSYFIEALTDELEARAWELIAQVDELGGAVEAIEQGFVQERDRAVRVRMAAQVESGERVIVGVNRFQEDDAGRVELHRIDPDSERASSSGRPASAPSETPRGGAALAAVREAALGEANLLPPLREALRAHCTIGEICETLRAEWGMYDAVRARP